MSLSANRIVYGIHSICPYQRANGLPYGILKVLGGGQLNLTAESEDLFGGSNKFAWASEAKTVSSEFSATVKSMPDFLFELFLGGEVVTTAASATGTVGTATNKKGSSIIAATGLVGVTLKAGQSANLKTGLYAMVAVSATTLDVYALTDIEFARGTDLEFVNDALKITATPITMSTGDVEDIPNTGLEITGGASATAFVVGDTAVFTVTAPHGGISEITLGKQASTFPEHGQLCVAAKRSDGSIFEIELYKVVGQGFPIGLEEAAFSIPELTCKVLYDSVKDKLATIRAIAGA
jgi:hypothetical protein